MSDKRVHPEKSPSPVMSRSSSTLRRISPTPASLSPTGTGSPTLERHSTIRHLRNGIPHVDAPMSPEVREEIARLRGTIDNKYRESKRGHIFMSLDDPTYSKFSRHYSVFMMLLILLATVCFVLESEATSPYGVLYSSNAMMYFDNIELVSVIFFTIEYTVRFSCCEWSPKVGPLWFMLELSNIIDFLACFPYWISLIAAAASPEAATATASGFGFIRVVRLIRVFRVFKFGRYSIGIQMFSGALMRSLQMILILLFTITLAVVMISSLMYLAEGDVESFTTEFLDVAGVSASKQASCYGTVPRTFWWAAVTMTTVGYGDCYPITVGGKVIAIITMLAGVVILALPITVVGANFQRMVEVFQEDTMIYSEADRDADGVVDEDELRFFLKQSRDQGILRKDINLTPQLLIAKFDTTGRNRLTFAEFSALKEYVLDASLGDSNTLMRSIYHASQAQGKELTDLKDRLARLEKMLSKLVDSSGVDDLPQPATFAPIASVPPP